MTEARHDIRFTADDAAARSVAPNVSPATGDPSSSSTSSSDVEDTLGSMRYLRGGDGGRFATSSLDGLSTADLADRARVQATWLKMALFQTDDVYWDYDIDAKRFTTFYFDDDGNTSHQVFENFPQYYIEHGRVHTDSIEAFRTFFERIGHGSLEGSSNFVLTDRMTGFFVWAVLTYRVILDDDGRPAHAVGIRRNHGKQTAGLFGEVSHDPIPDTALENLFGYIQANLTTNTVEYMLYQGSERTWISKSDTYDDVVRRAKKKVFRGSPSSRDVSPFTRRNLQSLYSHGRRWTAKRVRIVDSSGTIWRLLVSANVRLGSESRLPTAYIFLSDLGKRHQWESALATPVDFDEGTGAYTRTTAHEIVDHIVRTCESNEPSAVVAVTMHGIADVERHDAAAARRLRTDAAIALNALLDTDSVVWIVDDATMAVFIPHAVSGAVVQARLESALFSTRMSLAGTAGIDDIRLVAATVCGGILDLDYDAVFAQARELSASYENAVGDTVLMPRARDIRFKPRQDEATMYAERFPQEGGAHEWTRDDARFYEECLAAMLRADSHSSAISDALAKFGTHYDANRVYVMSISDTNRAVSVLFEWARHGRTSILRPFSKRTVDHFPLIKRYASATEPVLVAKPGEYDGDGNRAHGDTWRFAIVPMLDSADQKMVLCFENPHSNLSDWAPAQRIAPFLLSEWRKIATCATHEVRSTIVDQPVNLQAFRKAAELMTSERLSSMGVLIIDIPRIDEVMEQTGFAVAADAVRTMERALDGAFEPEAIYRTGDAEVIALCPDTSYDAFIQRCARVRTALVDAHPGMYRLGTSWSSATFETVQLAREARVIMMRDDGEGLHAAPAVLEKRFGNLDAAPAPKAFGAPYANDFDNLDVFLQPKIDVRTGELVGAEALARVYDERGQARTPTATIEKMEETGDISKLDYFVLDRVLALLDGWRERGLRAVPISSNFSRSTLLAPSALASILAILSHYPSIDPDMIEMEITETACDLGSQTITNLVDTFRDNGLRVALDDFGSRYSNASILSQARFDTIKIDRTLVSGLPDNDVSRMLVHNVAEICAKHNMECVAEGCETKEQARALAEEGCFCCQGFYYDKPMSSAAFERKYLTGMASSRRR